MIAQKITIAVMPWASGHRQRADRVGQQADHVRPLAADQIADLAVDQDERRRDERLERDRGLDRAHRRIEIVNDLRDRHVHQRRVDDQHEHRHRQQQRQTPVPRPLLSDVYRRVIHHRTPSVARERAGSRDASMRSGSSEHR